ncbi:MFS transporter [Chondrinema litorale]|uniref:MFS transporter n=1 Tax=Chondrinema litorale TaxID=2994555 RepID=UPI002542C462|nr:MFS transporter [Chondrinema litorale]UZR98666.1 MFS transporter [Chondrinema litorale]
MKLKTDQLAAQIDKSKSGGNYRWRICALLFFATTINYLDRQVLGILAPFLQEDMGWSEVDYGTIVSAFKIAYAIGLISMGNLLDRIGTRLGYAISISIWSLAGAAHAFAGTVTGFATARFTLGLGESANFPAAIKTVTEWFPKKERAFATGIFNSGSNIGSILAPLAVPFIAVQWGWQWAFIITGAIGFIWLIFWLTTYKTPEQHPKLSKEELAYIQQDQEETQKKIPWIKLLAYRETYAICFLKFVTDPVWWFFLFWLPKFLNSTHGISLTELGPPLITIYLVSDLGSIAGGWFSSYLIKIGKSVNFARKTTILICGIAALPIAIASRVDDLWIAVALISLGTAAHQACSANIFTIVSDVFPKNAIGSVVGIAGTAGALGGVVIAYSVGVILETTGSYIPIFTGFSLAYLVAWVGLNIGIPKLQQVKVE